LQYRKYGTQMAAHITASADRQSQWTETRSLQHAAVFRSVCNLWQAESERGIPSMLQILKYGIQYLKCKSLNCNASYYLG